MNVVPRARPALLIALALAGSPAAPPAQLSAAVETGTAAAQRPTVKLVAPTAGSTVAGPDVEVRVQATGVQLGSRGRNGAHVLLQLDQLPAMKSYAERFTFRGVDVGPHHLRAELRRADGGAFEPPVIAETEFSVRAAVGEPS